MSSILRSSAVMAAGTMVSRATGFVKASMLAAAIGITGLHADIFSWANTVPNMLYILVAGGVFNTVLVPQIVRAMKTDADGGEAYVARILTLSGLFLAGVSAVLVAAAPWVMRVLAGEKMFDPDLPEQTQSFINFARYCLPQVFFYGVFVLLGQVLNARGTFGPMMWAPIANNIVMIGVLATYLATFGGTSGDAPYTRGEELLLGLGSTFGIVVQTLVLIPYLRRSGVRYRPRYDFRGTGLGHTLRLGLWTVGFVIANQIAYVVVGRIATNASAAAALAGGSSAGYMTYSQAFLLLIVPHGVVTVSLATAALPRLSRLAADGEHTVLRDELAETLRQAMAIVVPFVVLLAVLAPFLATVMFSWGAAQGATSELALTLVAFAPALLFFTTHYLMLRGFYAMEDTRTPFFVQLWVSGTNIAAAVGYTWLAGTNVVAPLLALAYGSAFAVGAVLSVWQLSRRLGRAPLAGCWSTLGRLFVAALPAGLAAFGVTWGLEHLGLETSRKLPALANLAASGTLAVAVFVVLARLLRIREVNDIMNLVFGRLIPGRR